MKSNKGYTLVELLVAVVVLLIVMAEVGALMFNSQSLYRNGFYEVSVQEESQQVILQVQDLLMNATGWTRDADNHTKAFEVETKKYNGIPSDVITIYTTLPNLTSSGIPDGTYKSIRYRIGLAFDVNGGTLPGGDPIRPFADFGTDSHRFETLVLERAEGDPDSGSIDTPTYEVLAEGVRAIHLNYDNVNDAYTPGYEESDHVLFTVEMQNYQSSYSTETASVSIYLRNQPQTAKKAELTSSSGSSGTSNPEDKMVYILRVHKYNLKDYVSDYYDHFELKNSSDSTYYSLQTDGKCQLVTSLWDNWNYENVSTGGVDVYAYHLEDKLNGIDNKIKITLYTEKVQFDDGLLYTYQQTTVNTGLLSVFPVKGICVCSTCNPSHALEPQLYMEKVPGHDTESVIEFCSAFELIDKNGDVRTEMAVPFMEKNTTTNTLERSAFCLSKGLAAGRNDSVNTVKIPIGIGNISYKWYHHNSGDRLDPNGKPIMTNHSFAGNTDVNLGNDLTFTYHSNMAGTDNAIYLTTIGTFEKSSAAKYWKTFVEDAGGYMSVKITVTWPTGVSKAMVINAYLYPECEDSTPDQHKLILDRLAGAGSGTSTP